jgi:hypothetical protein
MKMETHLIKSTCPQEAAIEAMIGTWDRKKVESRLRNTITEQGNVEGGLSGEIRCYDAEWAEPTVFDSACLDDMHYTICAHVHAYAKGIFLVYTSSDSNKF